MPKQWLPSAIALPSAFQILSSNIFILTLLYFVQGIPYGFQARFLPVYLRANGTSLTTLGFIKLLLLPWLLKVIWAPLVDKWGTKRQWLLYSVFGLALTCLCGAAVSPKVLLYVCPVIFLLNFLAATQDIAVDGIAISILREDELGKGNTAQVVGYKLGSIAGGGFLVLLNDYVGWSGLFLNLTAVYVVTLAIIKQIPDLETSNKVKRGKGEKINTESRSTLPGHQNVETASLAHVRETCSHTVLRNGKLIKTNEHTSAITETADNQWENAKGFRCDEMCSAVHEEPIRMTHVSQWFDAVLSVPGTMWIAAFVLLYKLGEQGANGMFPLYIVDCGISASYVGLWTGVIGQSLSILGSLLSGWILSYSVKPTSILLSLFVMRLVPIVLMGCIIWCGTLTEDHSLLLGLSITSMCLLQLNGGLITTATFTMMMQCSQGAPQDMQATHWTLLATLEVMGKLSFMLVAGLTTDWLGYSVMFSVFIILSVIVIPMLWIKYQHLPKPAQKNY